MFSVNIKWRFSLAFRKVLFKAPLVDIFLDSKHFKLRVESIGFVHVFGINDVIVPFMLQ